MDLTEYTRETLRDLAGVFVIVETVKSDAEADGLSVTELQKDVELKLSQAGIRVLDHDEWRSTPGRPWLYVSVNTIKFLASYFFSLDVQLKQEVSLSRSGSISTSSSTWELGSLGMTVISDLPNRVRQAVDAYVQRFIDDYDTVNDSRTKSPLSQ
ncbi:MAG: hypothetical protein HY912_15330 [Desulfomonile tiedjei]|uniref:Uncharacterized protein n=1 Tax=Desulfomonile tiedjei TaxID=2358 RepID=A0A9D6Z1A3_9BACT|nr:hypothetical protein [Desulfomonile tiedjei]